MKSHIHRVGALFLDILQTVVLALAIFMLTYLFLVQPHEVKGNSMHPTFKNGERLLTNKVSYRFQNPKRGDVIVFEAPPDQHKDFIKRIIALPGETILIKGGVAYIGGKPLEEKYLVSSIQTQGGAFLSEGEEVTLGADEYIVMGDNRDHSSDSRNWGAIKRESIVGKAWLIYWPLPEIRLIPETSYAGF